MFRNQYFATNYQADSDLNFDSIKFENLNVHYSRSLPVSHAASSSTAALVLGYIFDPFDPKKDNDAISSTFLDCVNEKEFMHKVQNYSGRYVVIFKTNGVALALSDALGHRQIYFHRDGQKVFLTSSPKLFLHVEGIPPCINERKSHLISSKEFRANQNAWFGAESIDDRLNKVLPNRFLDLKTLQVKRRLYCFDTEASVTDVRALCGSILQGGLAAAVKRYTVMEPLTSGYDSRALLAASKDFRDRIRYYTFRRPAMAADFADILVPQKLSKILGINYQTISTEPLKDEFLRLYENEHIVPRVLSKTQNIQYHFYHSRDKGNVLDVKGSGGGMLRLVYGRTPGAKQHGIDVEMLVYFSGYPGNDYVTEQIRKWLPEAKEYAHQYGLAVQDLFYWEQRMGNWGADHGLEQDIALEEFWPFNNATLLLNGLRVAELHKCWPKHSFFMELIRDLWPDVLAQPINPKKNLVRSHVGDYVKSDCYRRYCAMRVNELTNNVLGVKLFRFF